MSLKTAVVGSSKKPAQKKNGTTETTKKAFDATLFNAGVAGYLRSAGHIPVTGDYMQHEAFNQAIEMWEINNAAARDSYDNAVEAISAFKSWLDSAGWHYVKAQTFHMVSLYVEVTMATPAGQLTIGATVEPYVLDHSTVMRDVKEHLQEQIRKAFPGSSKPQVARNNGNEEEEQERAIEKATCHTLRVYQYSGKRVYSVIPDSGPWQQYGIPLYNDVAGDFEVDLPKTDGEYEIDWEVEYELKPNGKPRRVVTISAE